MVKKKEQFSLKSAYRTCLGKILLGLDENLSIYGYMYVYTHYKFAQVFYDYRKNGLFLEECMFIQISKQKYSSLCKITKKEQRKIMVNGECHDNTLSGGECFGSTMDTSNFENAGKRSDFAGMDNQNKYYE